MVHELLLRSYDCVLYVKIVLFMQKNLQTIVEGLQYVFIHKLVKTVATYLSRFQKPKKQAAVAKLVTPYDTHRKPVWLHTPKMYSASIVKEC